MRPRVLLFLNSFHPGGSEVQTLQLTKLLHEESNFRVFLACISPKGMLQQEIADLDLGTIPSFKLNSFYGLNTIKQLYRCVQFMREKKINIVQTNDFYTNVFGITAAWLAGVPVRIASRRETGGYRTPRQDIVERQVFKFAHAIITNAKAVNQYLSTNGVRDKKTITIYNGVDLERVRTRVSRDEILRMFNLPDTENLRFITILANMTNQIKDHPMFLRAARQVRNAVPEARFIIAGEGDLTDQVRSYACELGLTDDVFFTGRCENVAELLSISDVCVLSSISEGFSNVILEYMAASKPCVVTDVGGAAEAITDGVTGYLVESGDDETMSKRIIYLLQDPESAGNMGMKARSVIEQKFSCQIRLNKTVKLYQRLLIRNMKKAPEILKKVATERSEQ